MLLTQFKYFYIFKKILLILEHGQRVYMSNPITIMLAEKKKEIKEG